MSFTDTACHFILSGGEKLSIRYHPDDFTPDTSHPAVGIITECEWFKENKFVKCQLPSIHAGWMSFRDVCDALEPLLGGKKISRIRQYRGTVGEKDVALATSLADDKEQEYLKDCEYCDRDGNTFTYEDAGKPEGTDIYPDGKVFICGGRRTYLIISP